MNHGVKKETGPSHKTLQDWRREIDLLDSELLRLLNRRARIACELAVIKTASGLPAYDPARERQVMAHMSAENKGPLGHESVIRIFRRIILETRRIGTRSMQQQRKKQSISYATQEQNNGH